MENYASTSVENFIKTIYNVERREGVGTKSGSIARELGITNAAATDMARKLAEKKLINYEKYKELKLTNTGEKLAVDVIRKHRLWETFLHRVLGLSLHEIHREAEKLEHATSSFLMEKISAFLGDPLVDPHGDPIPDSQGFFENSTMYLSLSETDENEPYKISRLSSSEEEFFNFCHSHHLLPGTDIKVRKHYLNNTMTEIEINENVLILNSSLANYIFVESKK